MPPKYKPYIPDKGMIPKLYGRRTATEVQAAGPRWKLLALFKPPELDRDPYCDQYRRLLYEAMAIPRNLFMDEFTLKPERSQDMACEVCGTKNETRTATEAILPQLRHVTVTLSTGGAIRVNQAFYVCDNCYPKIKKQIAEVAHVILALDECEHVD